LAGAIEVKFYGLLRRHAQNTAVEIAGDDMTVLTLLRRAEERTGRVFLDELLDRVIMSPAAGDRVDLFSPAGGG
jgi:molybdopterin converting factor small subunit